MKPRKKYAFGEVVDYMSSNSPLLDVLNQFNFLQRNLNEDSDESLLPKIEVEPLPEENTENVDNEEPKRKRTSIFGNDFLGFNSGPSSEEEDYSSYNAPRGKYNSKSSPSGSMVDRITDLESGGDYGAEAPNSSAKGRYQFIWSIHKDDINKVTGVKSANEFLNSPQAQDKYFQYWDKNTLTPTARKYISKFKSLAPGISPKGFDGEVSKAYNITGIPFAILLDPEGKIVDFNMRGAKLDAALSDIYGF